MQKDVLCIFKKCVKNTVMIFKEREFYILKNSPQKTSTYVKKAYLQYTLSFKI